MKTAAEYCLICLAPVVVASSAHSQTNETEWFRGAMGAMPPLVAGNLNTGVRSGWIFTDSDERTWDFGVGVDLPILQSHNPDIWQTVSGRWGVFSRFQYNSASFDLWGADYWGGCAWGVATRSTEFELLLYHESCHLGDEVLESGKKERRDISFNGPRILVGRYPLENVRVYGGVSYWPIAEPDELKNGVGFHLGTEVTDLPPAGRGFVAIDSECWNWRSWNPDVTCQAGIQLGRIEKRISRLSARMYFEFYSGRVRPGQYFDETETHYAAGLACTL